MAGRIAMKMLESQRVQCILGGREVVVTSSVGIVRSAGAPAPPFVRQAPGIPLQPALAPEKFASFLANNKNIHVA